MVIAPLAILSLLTLVHMKDRPELNFWFNSLQSKGGYPCCAHMDGSTIADVDWDTAIVDGKSHYRVYIEGEWLVVTDEEVVTSPNRYGPAMAWVYRSDNKPKIRCFMPGAGR